MCPAVAGSRKKEFFLLVFSVLFAIVLAEVGIRVYFYSKGIGRRDVRDILQRTRHEGPIRIDGGSGLFGLVRASPHDDIVYELQPRLEGTFKTATIRTNAHGFRGDSVLARGVDRHPRAAAHEAYAKALLPEIEKIDLPARYADEGL